MASQIKLEKLQIRCDAIFDEAMRRMSNVSEAHLFRAFSSNWVPKRKTSKAKVRCSEDQILDMVGWIALEVSELMEDGKHGEVVAKVTDFFELLVSRPQWPEDAAFSSLIIKMCTLRAFSYLGYQEYEKAVNDFTSVLDISAMLAKRLSQSSEQYRHNRYVQGETLYFRAMALRNLHDRHGQFADLRASVAINRMQGLDPGYRSCVQILMVTLVKAGAPRPHYTRREVRMWNKELGIEEFSPVALTCLGCGAPPSADVSLKQCGRCRFAWVCSAACQRASWPGHRRTCGAERKVVLFTPRSAVLGRIDTDHYFIEIGKLGPVVIVRDEGTGQLFESLSDRDVVFADEAPLPAAARFNAAASHLDNEHGDFVCAGEASPPTPASVNRDAASDQEQGGGGGGGGGASGTRIHRAGGAGPEEAVAQRRVLG